MPSRSQKTRGCSCCELSHRRTLREAGSLDHPWGPCHLLLSSGGAYAPLCHLQILVASDKACQLLGYSSHDLIGQKLTQFFLKPDSDMVEALSEEHLEADGRAALVFGTVVSAELTDSAAGCRPPQWQEQLGGGQQASEGQERCCRGLA